MYNIGLAEDATCRFGQEKEETPIHILGHCVGLAITRFLVLGVENSKASCYIKEPLSTMIGLIRREKLEITF